MSNHTLIADFREMHLQSFGQEYNSSTVCQDVQYNDVLTLKLRVPNFLGPSSSRIGFSSAAADSRVRYSFLSRLLQMKRTSPCAADALFNHIGICHGKT